MCFLFRNYVFLTNNSSLNIGMTDSKATMSMAVVMEVEEAYSR